MTQMEKERATVLSLAEKPHLMEGGNEWDAHDVGKIEERF